MLLPMRGHLGESRLIISACLGVALPGIDRVTSRASLIFRRRLAETEKAFAAIDLAAIELRNGAHCLFAADGPAAWESIHLAGDARRHSHPQYLRLETTGPDPRLFLPPGSAAEGAEPTTLFLRLRVSPGSPPND